MSVTATSAVTMTASIPVNLLQPVRLIVLYHLRRVPLTRVAPRFADQCFRI